jgi:hypothetical protein
MLAPLPCCRPLDAADDGVDARYVLLQLKRLKKTEELADGDPSPRNKAGNFISMGGSNERSGSGPGEDGECGPGGGAG